MNNKQYTYAVFHISSSLSWLKCAAILYALSTWCLSFHRTSDSSHGKLTYLLPFSESLLFISCINSLLQGQDGRSASTDDTANLLQVTKKKHCPDWLNKHYFQLWQRRIILIGWINTTSSYDKEGSSWLVEENTTSKHDKEALSWMAE